MSLSTAIAALLLAAAAAPADGPANPGFEQGDEGAAPAGWTVPAPARDAGYRARTEDEHAYAGEHCARLAFEGDGTPSTFGNLMQSIDARPFRGQRIRLSARVRVAGGVRGQMWLRADLEGGGRGLFDNMGDRPVQGGDWTECTIEGEIDERADRLALGFVLIGAGELWADDLRLEVLGDLPPPPPLQPAAPLEGRALENVAAFARLYGYVRHFHPSDEAAAADWEAVAIAGVRAVEDAGSPSELAEALEACFAPLAPTVRVHAADREPWPAELPLGAPRVALWTHRGWGQHVRPGAVSLYASERQLLPVTADLPEGALAPDEAFTAELGGGVACRVPLTVLADDAGTLPRGAPDEVAALPARYRRTPADRATRLAAVVVVWNVLQHFYPYFDVVDVDWGAELERALASAATDADERACLSTLRRLVSAVGDGHGNVYHAVERDDHYLPLAWDWVEGELVVTHVPEPVRGGAAVGDAVVAVDGERVEDAYRRLAGEISGATEGWIRWKAHTTLASGPAGERRTLELEAPDGERKRVELTTSVRDLDLRAEPRPAPLTELELGIWYVDLARVEDAAFEAAIPDLARAAGIVFDMRGYPRSLQPRTFLPHLSREPLESAQWHVPRVVGPDGAFVYPPHTNWDLPPDEPYFEGRRAFLLDGRAISYAESCMGIVEHYELGAIVGSASAGTNGNINPFEAPGGYRVIFTGMRVLKQDGSRHHGVGILPTVPVERTRRGVIEGRDEVLERALELVRG